MLLAWAKGRDFQGTSRQALLGGSKHIAGGLLHPSLNSNLHPVLREIRFFYAQVTFGVRTCAYMRLAKVASMKGTKQSRLTMCCTPEILSVSQKKAHPGGIALSICK